MEKLDLYNIELKYIRDLSRVDDNVMSISPQRSKENRPFVGVIVLMNDIKYCIPLTSPKAKFKNKKSQIDFIKIFDEGRRGEDGQFWLIGVLNINNMIPVDNSVIKKIDLSLHKNDPPEVKKSKILMQKQIKWCRANVSTIHNRAGKVYSLVVDTPEKNRNLTKRTSKFKELEKVLDEYLSKNTKK